MTQLPPTTKPEHRAAYDTGAVIAGKYRLDRKLGVGGQGSVWQAWNLALDARVAIKIVCADNDAGHARRLLLEARTIARLEHPGIVRVFDVMTTEQGDHFLMMELLDGASLGQRLEQQTRLPPTEAVQMLLPIADALCVVHDQGIVHRDVKPDNIHLSFSGDRLQPKLLDFGIAKTRKLSLTARLTGVGALIGSLDYLSPEQVWADPDIDQRADVWGFSVTLYQCITGELPFVGGDHVELLRDIVEREPRSILEHGVDDAALWSILRRGLEKSKSARWPTMHALGTELAKWLSERGVEEDACGVSLESKWLRAEPVTVVPLPYDLTVPVPKIAVSKSTNPTLPSVPGRAGVRYRGIRIGVGGAAVLAFGLVAFLAGQKEPLAAKRLLGAGQVATRAAINAAPMIEQRAFGRDARAEGRVVEVAVRVAPPLTPVDSSEAALADSTSAARPAPAYRQKTQARARPASAQVARVEAGPERARRGAAQRSTPALDLLDPY